MRRLGWRREGCAGRNEWFSFAAWLVKWDGRLRRLGLRSEGKVIWLARGWFLSYGNAASSGDFYPNSTGGKHISSCQSVFHPLHSPLPHSCAVSLRSSSLPSMFLLALCFLLILPLPCQCQSTTKPQSLFVFLLLLWSCLVLASGVTHTTLWQVTRTISGTIGIHVTDMPVNIWNEQKHAINLETNVREIVPLELPVKSQSNPWHNICNFIQSTLQCLEYIQYIFIISTGQETTKPGSADVVLFSAQDQS